MQRFNQINHVIDHTLPHVSRRRGLGHQLAIGLLTLVSCSSGDRAAAGGMVGGACPLTGLGGGSSGTPGVKAPTDANKNDRDWWPSQLDLRPLR